MQIPIIKGVYTGENADYKTLYPLNMVPVIQETGVSSGYLRPAEGIVELGEGPGVSRGAINWDGVHYRVMGSKLCSISEGGEVTVLGDVGNLSTNPEVSMTYSFDRLAISSVGNLYYYDGTSLTQVVDEDLGTSNDVVWISGYFFSTDGEFIVASEITDPTSFLPDRYASSELDPDPIVSLLRLRNELYVINRYTIEVFQNVGGTGFPFQVVTGAQIQRGAIGPKCSVVYEDTIAFLGSGPNEAPAVYLGVSGGTQKISTREIDELLTELTEEELSEVVLETLNDKSQAFLHIRLPDRTLVYDLVATQAAGTAVWHILSSGITSYAQYRAKNIIFCYDKWQVGDTASFSFGVFDNKLSTHFGDTTIWEFGTQILYNESRGAIIRKLELVALTGRASGSVEPVISTSYSNDGRIWSQDRPITVGVLGDRLKRIVWWRQGTLRNIRMQRFRGDSHAYIAVSRLEADIEPLGV